MNLRQKLQSAYDPVHAPEDVTERLKQELYQKDINGDAETEISIVREKKRPPLMQYAVSIAAVLALCCGAGWLWQYARQNRNPIRPQSQVIVESAAPSEAAAIDWVEGIVPDVAQYRVEYARKILEQCGYHVDIRYEESTEVTAGNTIRTEPAGKETLAPGETVILYVSKGGTDEVEMPNCVGLTLEQARVLLEYYQLSVLTNYDPSSEKLPGTVIAQDVAEGNVLRQNQDRVILTVAGEREKIEHATYVGDLTGMSIEDATAILDASHVPYTISYSFSVSNPKGTVIGQTRGNYYSAGDAPIHLTVAE